MGLCVYSSGCVVCGHESPLRACEFVNCEILGVHWSPGAKTGFVNKMEITNNITSGCIVCASTVGLWA